MSGESPAERRHVPVERPCKTPRRMEAITHGTARCVPLSGRHGELHAVTGGAGAGGCGGPASEAPRRLASQPRAAPDSTAVARPAPPAPAPAPQPAGRTCFVCGNSLEGVPLLNAEIHINACLDRQQAASRRQEAAPPASLAPSSSARPRLKLKRSARRAAAGGVAGGSTPRPARTRTPSSGGRGGAARQATPAPQSTARARPGGGAVSCMVCGQDLSFASAFARQAHVNDCLNRLDGPSAAPGGVGGGRERSAAASTPEPERAEGARPAAIGPGSDTWTAPGASIATPAAAAGEAPATPAAAPTTPALPSSAGEAAAPKTPARRIAPVFLVAMGNRRHLPGHTPPQDRARAKAQAQQAQAQAQGRVPGASASASASVGAGAGAGTSAGTSAGAGAGPGAAGTGTPVERGGRLRSRPPPSLFTSPAAPSPSPSPTPAAALGRVPQEAPLGAGAGAGASRIGGSRASRGATPAGVILRGPTLVRGVGSGAGRAPVRPPPLARRSATAPAAGIVQRQGTLNRQVSRSATAVLMNAARRSKGRPVSPGGRGGKGSSGGGGGSGGGGWGNFTPRRNMPWYKKMPGTPFVVDAFNFKDTPSFSHFVLTHFHSDHYGGLNSKFCAGTIYCNTVTASLVRLRLGVASKYLRPIRMNTPTVIEGVELTFLDANHCPGSAMILFRLRDGRTYLHVGDFRWHHKMTRYPALAPLAYGAGGTRRLDILYLDTTYCNPNYAFPSQEAAVLAVVNVARKFAQRKDVCLMFGCYTIGKERLFMEVAAQLDEKVLVSKAQFKIMSCLEWPLEVMARLTTDETQARIHVTHMGALNIKRLEERYRKLKGRYSKIVAFSPTGWAYRGTAAARGVKHVLGASPSGQLGVASAAGNSATFMKCKKVLNGKVEKYGVPYSEHSSFSELRQCVESLDALKIIPTVNVRDGATVKEMLRLLRAPLAEL